MSSARVREWLDGALRGLSFGSTPGVSVPVANLDALLATLAARDAEVAALKALLGEARDLITDRDRVPVVLFDGVLDLIDRIDAALREGGPHA